MNFLTDTQASMVFVGLLRAVGETRGFTVRTAVEEHLHLDPFDHNFVIRARELGDFVYLTFDKLQGMTKVVVAKEIYERGGRVIAIWGGPDQAPERAIGRFLFHWPDWYPFLEKNDGRVDIKDINKGPAFFTRDKLAAVAGTFTAEHFHEYIAGRAAAKHTPLRRPARSPSRMQSQPSLESPTA